MTRLPLEFTFIDNGGAKARTGFYLPSPANVADIDSTVAAYAAVLSAISSAAILSARWEFYIDNPVPLVIEPESNCYERAYLIFRDGADRGVVSIPSPRAVLFDVDGAYRNIRIQRSTLALLGVLAPLEAAVAGSALADGEPFPSTYSVGGTGGLTP